ncbi:hypothetical protein Q4F19_14020 [Sphingomonas sp. BIUV-7]|uniref:Regulatory protein RecX n=1 Tax=Sphingomonas natans TaxID=3063330 RepID=A0ABT8YB12_9SPHN|nr:hypothetical protein [Sphingomonas sp. BIUV-7]MDO6415505.1 hypothetical protein [Sphingomonas sp. BIUV-7]
MELRDRARRLAESGDYADSHAVIFALFKLGYGRAPRAFGFLERFRLNQICRASTRRSRTIHS